MAFFSVAPMMDWTDRYCRVFHRLLSKRAVLYTEMVTAQAVLFGNPDHVLGTEDFSGVVLQLGGSDPDQLARASEKAAKYGYRALNLNCGCPSARVQSGRFGACLMEEPQTVKACVSAMAEASGLPVTVKCRLGVDDHDERDGLFGFVDIVGEVCDTFIVHARKAWLKGLSPKENRDIPPLNYPLVFDLKARWPGLTVILNGGISDMDGAWALREQGMDGVMVGRAAYHTPWILSRVDEAFHGESISSQTRSDVLRAFLPYVRAWVERGVPMARATKSVLGLYHGQPGGRLFRRRMSEEIPRFGKNINGLEEIWLSF